MLKKLKMILSKKLIRFCSVYFLYLIFPGIVQLIGVDSSVVITEGNEPFEYSITLGASKPAASVWIATKVASATGDDTAHLRSKLLVEPSVLIFEPEEWTGGKVCNRRYLPPPPLSCFPCHFSLIIFYRL